MTVAPARVLLAPDPALPARDTLLDPVAAVARLARLPLAQGSRGAVEIQRVRYQPGRSLRVTQRLGGAADTPAVVSTRGVPADRYERLVEASAAATAGEAPVVADPATASVSWLFPHDRRLATLPEVWHRTGSSREVVGPRWAATRLAALSPEKAATLACLDGDGAPLAYAKVYPSAEAAVAAAERLAIVGNRGGPPLAPAVLGVATDQRATVLAPVAGRPLSELTEQELPDGAAALGMTLAHLHALPPGNLPPFRRFSPPSLQAAAEAVLAARPDLAEAVLEVASTLASRQPSGPTVPLHGDARLGNGLRTPAGVVLVDFDEAGAGDPAVDLAGVLASLRRARLLGTLTADAEQALSERFLTAYGMVAGRPEEEVLRWHTAAALLVQGAARAVRRVQVPALRRLEVLLAHAAALTHGLDAPAAPTSISTFRRIP